MAMKKVVIVVVLLTLTGYSRASTYSDPFERINPLLLNRLNNNMEDEGSYDDLILDDYEQYASDPTIKIIPGGAEELVENVFQERKRSDGGGDMSVGPRDKKFVKECTARKTVKKFTDGNETIPRTYSEYECVAMSQTSGIFGPPFINFQSHDICLAKHCESVEKEMYYILLNKDPSSGCSWSLKSKIVRAGCDCVAHKKFGIHSQH